MAKELGGFVGDSVLEHTNGMWAYFPPIRLNNTNNFFLPTHPWNRLKLKLFSQGLYISAPIFFPLQVSSARFLGCKNVNILRKYMQVYPSISPLQYSLQLNYCKLENSSKKTPQNIVSLLLDRHTAQLQ